MDNESSTTDQSGAGAATTAQPTPEQSVAAAPAELENLETSASPPAPVSARTELPVGTGARPSLDLVLEVPVTVSLEVGRTTMSVGELLKLGQGAVVELDRAVGEPLDVMVNGVLVARGEIVLVSEKFGIRLTSIIERAEAISSAQAAAQ